MTRLRIQPSTLQGTIHIPASKSHTLRAILLGSLAKGKSHVRNYLHSPDTTAMIEAMRAFGTKIDISSEFLGIQGLNHQLKAAENVIDSGNSGQVLRFVGALAGLCPTYTVITGDHSIRHNRPVTPLLEAMTQLGAFAVSARQDGCAPIIIKGLMQCGKATLSGQDSQPVSGMLIAASFLQGKTLLKVTNPGEKPWIDLTLHWLQKFGITIEHHDYAQYTIPGNARIEGFDMSIPGDFSSAAFPIAAALVTNSELLLTNMDMTDCQGDKKIIDVLIQMGAKIDIDASKKTLFVRKNSVLSGQVIDVNDFIDATPILAVIACYAHGTTQILNAQIARKKESDRLHAIATELKKMGGHIEETPDGLIIQNSTLKGSLVDSWHDHRIAMSLAIAGLGASGDTLVDRTECIAKTYPGFAHDFRLLGASIEAV